MSLLAKRSDSTGTAGPGGGGSFLPEDYLRRKSERRSIVISLALFAIVTMGVVGAFFVTHRQWNTVKERQADINKEYALETQKIEQLTKLEAQKAEMLEKADVTTALVEKVPRSILLAELINRMPKQLTLTELNLKSNRIKDVVKPTNESKSKPRSLAGPATKAAIKAKAKDKEKEAQADKPKPVAPKFEQKLELVGLSATDEDVADYVTALNLCPLLQKVDLIYSGSVTIDDLEMRKFRVEAMIRPTADARQIEPLHVPRLPSIPGLTSAAPKYELDELDPTKPRRAEKTAHTSAGKE
jgi:Tfp pilus assembly protein PilN